MKKNYIVYEVFEVYWLMIISWIKLGIKSLMNSINMPHKLKPYSNINFMFYSLT